MIVYIIILFYSGEKVCLILEKVNKNQHDWLQWKKILRLYHLIGIEQINTAVTQLDQQTQVVSNANEKEFIGKDEVKAK